MGEIQLLEGKIGYLSATRTAFEWLQAYGATYGDLGGVRASDFPPGELHRDVFLYHLTGVRAHGVAKRAEQRSRDAGHEHD